MYWTNWINCIHVCLLTNLLIFYAAKSSWFGKLIVTCCWREEVCMRTLQNVLSITIMVLPNATRILNKCSWKLKLSLCPHTDLLFRWTTGHSIGCTAALSGMDRYLYRVYSLSPPTSLFSDKTQTCTNKGGKDTKTNTLILAFYKYTHAAAIRALQITGIG